MEFLIVTLGLLLLLVAVVFVIVTEVYRPSDERGDRWLWWRD